MIWKYIQAVKVDGEEHYSNEGHQWGLCHLGSYPEFSAPDGFRIRSCIPMASRSKTPHTMAVSLSLFTDAIQWNRQKEDLPFTDRADKQNPKLSQ